MYDFPSYEEQKEVRDYVMERMLPRPDTDIRKVGKCAALFLCVYAALFGVGWAAVRYLLSPLIPALSRFVQAHPVGVPLVGGAILLVLCLAPVMKKALIGAVRFYQHYASEDVRRRCLCKPTCSEYAILVLQKYGVIRGSYKIYIRLFHTCRGNIFFKDEP